MHSQCLPITSSDHIVLNIASTFAVARAWDTTAWNVLFDCGFRGGFLIVLLLITVFILIGIVSFDGFWFIWTFRIVVFIIILIVVIIIVGFKWITFGRIVFLLVKLWRLWRWRSNRSRQFVNPITKKLFTLLNFLKNNLRIFFSISIIIFK